MIAVEIAKTADDFDTAVGFFRTLAAWDAAQSAAHGVPAELILELFHAHDTDPTAMYRAPDARLFIARADGTPAGCVGFDSFDQNTVEIHRLFVDPVARGQGAGQALMAAALAEAARLGRTRVLIETATFMTSAIALYTALGFTPCPPFRPSPPSVAHLEVFLSRDL